MAQAVDDATLAPVGDPVQIANDVGEARPAPGPAFSRSRRPRWPIYLQTPVARRS